MASNKLDASQVKQAINDVQHKTRHAATSPVIIWLARLGYATKGLVYFIIGALAVRLAFGLGGKATDQRGALRALADLPAGRILLYIAAIGLLGFTLWSFIQAIFDTEGKGKKFSGIIARVGYAITGLSYGALCVGTYYLAMGQSTSGKSSTGTAQDWTGRLLKQPFGVPLVVFVGVVILGLGIFFYVKAYQAKFRRRLQIWSLPTKVQKFLVFLGRFGYVAMGTNFVIVGIFLIQAALHHNASEAKGLDTSLRELTNHPFGPVWLGLVALGFVAYGVYSFVEARYRRVGPS